MATGKDTLWERFLKPVVRMMIDEEKISQLYQSIDWEQESDRFRNPSISYPAYYNQNFHGIEKGYLNSGAAVSYDPITQYVLMPNETWVRQSTLDAISCKPRRILDLGCGTGSSALMLKRAFPDAEVIGLDLSPYMLVMAEYRAKAANLEINWHHGNAESTSFPDSSFDVVTASLLFHETPPTVTKAILQEAFRLLTPGGQGIILDGNQSTLRQTIWLTEIFEEPYIQAYAEGNLDAWMGAAGFEAVRTEDVWWVQQVTSGVKPVPREETYSYTAQRGSASEYPSSEVAPAF